MHSSIYECCFNQPMSAPPGLIPKEMQTQPCTLVGLCPQTTDKLPVMIAVTCHPSSCWLVFLDCSEIYNVLNNVKAIPLICNCLLVFFPLLSQPFPYSYLESLSNLHFNIFFFCFSLWRVQRYTCK